MADKRRLPWAFVFNEAEKNSWDKWGRAGLGRLWYRGKDLVHWLRAHWRPVAMAVVPVVVLLLAIGAGRLLPRRENPDQGLKTAGRITEEKRQESPEPITSMLQPIRGRISTTPGWRKHPVLGDWRYHSGVDFMAPPGSPVYAAQDGKVKEINPVVLDEPGGASGYRVVIAHSGGWESIYELEGTTLVRIGDQVRRGAAIARLPATAPATGKVQSPSLHFVLTRQGKEVDPRPWLE